ncbi:MAG: hypothetical protein JNK25_09495 [Phycisphaerae bacterium]|nr:hypothetical protein [Phycisphaerae bacterium]
MEPIRRTSPAGRPQNVDAAAPATPAAPGFSIGAAENATPVTRPEFSRIAARISDGLARNLSRDDIMRDVIAVETRERFGPLASSQMADSVAESFRTDPALCALVAKLFAAAA